MNELDKKRNGTSFRGYLYARYYQLVSVFGEPRRPEHSDNKIDVEWVINTPHGIATIYNYKDDKAYRGKLGHSPEEIYEWHVGGKTRESYELIKARLHKSISERHA